VIIVKIITNVGHPHSTKTSLIHINESSNLHIKWGRRKMIK
jgi:hypothetical protein